mmetsp:Transcript_53215/g.100004  ORF Transcript_53215/g.100004 Transcript_53215/m.100004 type:complete len:137 (-) Transcript_53215:418-828(-)
MNHPSMRCPLHRYEEGGAAQAGYHANADKAHPEACTQKDSLREAPPLALQPEDAADQDHEADPDDDHIEVEVTPGSEALQKPQDPKSWNDSREQNDVHRWKRLACNTFLQRGLKRISVGVGLTHCRVHTWILNSQE